MFSHPSQCREGKTIVDTQQWSTSDEAPVRMSIHHPRSRHNAIYRLPAQPLNNVACGCEIRPRGTVLLRLVTHCMEHGQQPGHAVSHWQQFASRAKRRR